TFSLTKAGSGQAAAPTVYGPGSWKTLAVLTDGTSSPQCSREPTTYSFDLRDDRLTVESSVGAKFTAVVPADGRLKQEFKAAGGAYVSNPRLEMSGNARTRDLEVTIPEFGCRWKLSPF